MEQTHKDKASEKILSLTVEKTMQNNLWMNLFFSLLIISVLIIAYQDRRQVDEPMIYYKEKYEELEGSFLDLAKSHSYILDTMMKNNIDLQSYLPEFAGKSKEEYLEYLRRRIIAMQVEIDRIERQHRK